LGLLRELRLIEEWLVGLAFRRGKKGKIPKFFYKDHVVHNPITGKKTTLTSGEKQRYVGMTTLGSAFGALGGGIAGGVHLNRIKRDRKYGYSEGDE